MPIAAGRQAIAARLEKLAGSHHLLGAEYARVGNAVGWGVHVGGTADEFPPDDDAPVIGGGLAYVGWSPAICPAASATFWREELEDFSSEPGDAQNTTLLLRLGVGLAVSTTDSIRLVAYVHPHYLIRRVTSEFGDAESTESDGDVLLDAGGAIGGGRFWASGGVRINFPDDPGEDILGIGVALVRAGVRF